MADSLQPYRLLLHLLMVCGDGRAWGKASIMVAVLFASLSLVPAGQGSLPEWVDAGAEDIIEAGVLAVEELTDADLVILSGGYETGYRAGMVGYIQRDGKDIAEVLLVEVRPQVMAAIIRDLSDGFSIQPGDTFRPRITRF